MSMALAVVRIMENEGIGQFNSIDPMIWSLHVGDEPDSPEQVLSVTQYAFGGGTISDGETFEMSYRRISIRGRGKVSGYLDLDSKMEEARSIFVGRGPETIEGHKFGGFWVITEPGFIGYDKNKRPLFTMNVNTLWCGRVPNN